MNQTEFSDKESSCWEEEKQLLLLYFRFANHNFFDSLFSCDSRDFHSIEREIKFFIELYHDAGEEENYVIFQIQR